MQTELDNRIKMAEAKMQTYEIGSEPYLMYKEIRDELIAKNGAIKLHVDGGAVCDGCQ